MAYWLYKTEPEDWSWDDMVRERETVWDGLGNNQALMFVRQSQPGDLVMFYETSDRRHIVGIMEITSEPYSDPTKGDPRFAVVDVKVHSQLNKPVSLRTIKEDGGFREWLLVRNSRLGAMPVDEDIWHDVLEMGGGTFAV